MALGVAGRKPVHLIQRKEDAITPEEIIEKPSRLSRGVNEIEAYLS